MIKSKILPFIYGFFITQLNITTIWEISIKL